MDHGTGHDCQEPSGAHLIASRRAPKWGTADVPTISYWLENNDFQSVEQIRGCLSEHSCPDTTALPDQAIKFILAGADVTMVASVIYQHRIPSQRWGESIDGLPNRGDPPGVIGRKAHLACVIAHQVLGFLLGNPPNVITSRPTGWIVRRIGEHVQPTKSALRESNCASALFGSHTFRGRE